MSDMDDVIVEFLIESNEGLDQVDQDLVALEKDPKRTELLGSIFRVVHTIKGTAGFLAYSKLEKVTHSGENLLSKLRDGELEVDTDITTGLLAMVDAVRQILGFIDQERTEGNADYTNLIKILDSLTIVHPGLPKPAAQPAEELPATEQAPPQPAVSIPEPELSPLPAPPPPEAPPKTSECTVEVKHGSPIRVDVGLLDKLMNLVGELVLARNQILQYSASQENASFIATSQRLNLITTELQEGVMKTRMQPIGNVWNKFPRVVRDLAHQVDKQVQIEMEGEETELDKTIIEAIKDPLTHVVRNAVDHGLELPADREAVGKPAVGRLFLRAYHEGGQVNIEISDDGAGINPQKIRDKAITKGLVTAEQAARMNEREMTSLLFLPGFSTAAAITNISGRGVGMDVVKTNIEKIGGSVDLQSVQGQGTTLRLKIPLTLAIIPALIVSSGGDCYAIPQVNLLELVRLEGDLTQQIESIHGTPVYRLRGNLLPLVYLNAELGIEDTRAEGDALNIVVVQADDQQFGLVVDTINDTEEIVVKPLGKALKAINTYAGATIMGDGRVALILDVMGLAQRARVVSESRDRAIADEQSDSTSDGATDREALLLVGVGPRGRMAIPLSSIARLEEIPGDSVEYAAEQEVVQYRGEILPLMRLSEMLRTRSDSDGDPMQVVVYTREGRSMGLVVDRILDVVEESYSVKRRGGRRGILGSAVIQGRVTDLLDLEGLIRQHDPTFFETPAGVGA